MLTVHPYLNFQGNAEEAFAFYRSVFGGSFTNVTRFRDLPGNPMEIPEQDLDKIANIGLPLGGGAILMATDVLPSFSEELRPGNNVYINLQPHTKEDAERLFAALAKGGEVELPLGPTDWAELYASFKDRYGVRWMVNYTGHARSPLPPQTPANHP